MGCVRGGGAARRILTWARPAPGPQGPDAPASQGENGTPDLSSCFEDSVLVSVPVAFLLFASVARVVYLARSSRLVRRFAPGARLYQAKLVSARGPHHRPCLPAFAP